MSTQHRGTPWHTCNDDDGNKYVSAQFQDICRLVNEGDVNANAAFIVRAVNCHEELVAVIEALGEFGRGGYFDKSLLTAEWCDRAKAVLAKARNGGENA